MGCGSDITTKEYNNTVKIIDICIFENLINLKLYKNLLKSDFKDTKHIVSSIIMEKESQLKILKEIYILSTGNTPRSKKIDYIEKANIDYIIKREFSYINHLKNLRYSLPTWDLKNAINTLLIDQNTIINKLLYLNQNKNPK